MAKFSGHCQYGIDHIIAANNNTKDTKQPNNTYIMHYLVCKTRTYQYKHITLFRLFMAYLVPILKHNSSNLWLGCPNFEQGVRTLDRVSELRAHYPRQHFSIGYSGENIIFVRA